MDDWGSPWANDTDDAGDYNMKNLGQKQAAFADISDTDHKNNANVDFQSAPSSSLKAPQKAPVLQHDPWAALEDSAAWADAPILDEEDWTNDKSTSRDNGAVTAQNKGLWAIAVSAQGSSLAEGYERWGTGSDWGKAGTASSIQGDKMTDSRSSSPKPKSQSLPPALNGESVRVCDKEDTPVTKDVESPQPASPQVEQLSEVGILTKGGSLAVNGGAVVERPKQGIGGDEQSTIGELPLEGQQSLRSEATTSSPPATPKAVGALTTPISDESSTATGDKEVVSTGNDDFGEFGDLADHADFDDFVEQVPSVPETPPKPAIPMAIPAFEIDASLVQKLYPIPTTAPRLPILEEEIIHTVGARRAWYRLTKGGTLRINAADEDDYVRVTWAGSKVREEVHRIVSKWASESRSSGAGGTKASQGPSAMFGWGAASNAHSQDGKKEASLSAGKKNPPSLQGHTRHSSEMGSQALVQGRAAMSSINKQTDSSPLTPAFGWASFSNQISPPPKTVHSNQTSPVLMKKNISTTALPPANPLPTSRRLSVAQKQTQGSPAAPSPKSSRRSSTSISPKIAQADPQLFKTTQPISAVFDEWASFESLQRQPVSTPTPITTQISDDWGEFESLVPSGSTSSTSIKPVVLSSTISSGMDDEWTSFDPFTPPRSSVSGSLQQSPQSNTNSIKAPQVPKAPDVAKPSPISPISVVLAPSKPTIPPIAVNHKQKRTGPDDDWGEMQSPIKSPDTPTPKPPSMERSISSGINGKSVSDLFVGLSGFATSTTVPTTLGYTTQTTACPAQNTSRSNMFDFGNTPSGEFVRTQTRVSQSSADNWDLSCFDKPSPADNQQPSQQGTNDLWDTPVVPQERRLNSEDDKTMKRIIDGLPNLSYMLM